MYSNKTNINLLTAHLLAHNIEDIVVCPGSRNAPIIHNLYEVGSKFRLHPITDERSAAFVAIGLWTKKKKPIAICVTSGSAILNCIPGIAEAAFRQIPIIMISADRPEVLLGKLDGQTLPQQDACSPYAQCWQIEEITTDEALQQQNLRLAEAFSTLNKRGGQPIHLNIPISEPLFEFTTTELPTAEVLPKDWHQTETISARWLELLHKSKLPLLIIGQYEGNTIPAVKHFRQYNQLLVYAEHISNQQDARMALWLDQQKLCPDVVIHIGGCLVNKFFKQHLRTITNLPVLRIDETDDCPDTFLQHAEKLKASPVELLQQLADILPSKSEVANAYKQLSDEIEPFAYPIEALFVANSTAVRWTNRQWPIIQTPVYCNRGTNGIEGSLSTAAGYSLVADNKVLCIIGDLSFFYDANALWNQHLDGRLRILLLNNQCGAIFHHLPGLRNVAALPNIVAAAHHNTAKGIATSYHCTYIEAKTSNLDQDADALINRLLEEDSLRPVILEVFCPI